MDIRLTLRNVSIACLISIQVWLPCLVLAQTGPGAGGAPAPVGIVSSVSGGIFARSGSGEEVLLKAGDVFGANTTFRTGPDATATLLFADGQNVTLSSESMLRLDEYRFDARDAKSSKATLGLLSGMMRLVTGAIHARNQDALFITAGKASIDILSKDVTAFVVEVDPKALSVGALAVTVGEVVIQAPVGPLTVVSAEQFTRWQEGAAPTAPAPLAAAPAVFQAAVAASRATVLPSTMPVDIQSAAVQAALAALPATGAGPAQPQALQAQATQSAAAAVVPAITPGGGRGCVGSPC